MKNISIFIVSLGLPTLLLFGCNQSQEKMDDAASAPGFDSIRDSVLQELIDADEAWDRATVTADSFVSFFTDDGIWFFMDGSFKVSGKEDIRTIVSKFWARPGFVLDWEAMSVGINKTYDMGYTAGEWQASHEDSTGQRIEYFGSYIANWQKMESGEWKVAVEVEYPHGGLFPQPKAVVHQK